MVVFTCNHCGESLQKPRVEKHYSFQCRNYKSLTCVDCFKDFKNEEYVVHTKCITEEERYSAKGSIPGGIVKKGDVKQESWMEMIKMIVENEINLKPAVKNLFNTISSYSNVPRKKPKFINFLKSSMGGRINLSDIEQVWTIIENYKQKNVQNQTNGNSVETGIKRKKENGTNNEVSPIKRTKLNDELKSVPDLKPEEDKFSFKNTILSILKSKSSISCNKLQKKVLSAYKKEMGIDYTDKTVKKFNQKLRKTPNIVIQDDVVQLKEA